MKQKKNKALKVPFYAQLLSNQEMMRAGGSYSTSPTKDAQTEKYPSDQEDTNPLWDQAQTQKYPSDGDDSTPVTDAVEDR